MIVWNFVGVEGTIISGESLAVQALGQKLLQLIGELKQALQAQNIPQFTSLVQQIMPLMQKLNLSVNPNIVAKTKEITKLFTMLLILGRKGDTAGAMKSIEDIEDILKSVVTSAGKSMNQLIDKWFDLVDVDISCGSRPIYWRILEK